MVQKGVEYFSAGRIVIRYPSAATTEITPPVKLGRIKGVVIAPPVKLGKMKRWPQTDFSFSRQNWEILRKWKLLRQ